MSALPFLSIVDGAAYTRARRAKAAAAGKCIECALRVPEAGKKTCRTCLDKKADRKAAYMEVGLCRCGHKPIGSRKRCSRCAKRDDMRELKRVRARKRLGLCWKCSDQTKAVAGRKMCRRHLDANAANFTRDANARVARGRCRHCQFKAAKGHTMCHQHLKRLRVDHKAFAA